MATVSQFIIGDEIMLKKADECVLVGAALENRLLEYLAVESCPITVIILVFQSLIGPPVLA